MKFCYLLSLFAMARAFTSMPLPRTAPALTQLSLLDQSHVEAIFQKGEQCAEGECSVDEVSSLLEMLKGQQTELTFRLKEVKEMVETLEKTNKKDERKVDEIRETVRAIYRVFQLGDKASGNDYPSLSKPMGWSGEVGDGPTTAYDALPPKKYKA